MGNKLYIQTHNTTQIISIVIGGMCKFRKYKPFKTTINKINGT